MTSKDNTRSIQYDALKGICIFFVVCIHFVYRFFTPEQKPASFEAYNYITGFAVPLFLVLGGFFFAKKFLCDEVSIDRAALKSILTSFFYRVLVPYYIFVTILSCYNFSVGNPVFWWHFLLIDSNSHGLYYLIIYVYSFLWSLFILYLLQTKVSKQYFISLIPLLSLVFFPIVFMNSDIHRIVFRHLPLIAFFAIGIPLYFTQDFLKNKVSHYNYKTVLVTSLLIAALTAIIYYLRHFLGPFPVFSTAPTSVWMLFYCALAFLFAINILSIPAISWLADKLMLVSFGVNSLFIFLIHPYLIKVFIPIIESATSSLEIPINSNMFLLPVLVIAYFTTMLSHFSIRLLPVKIRNIF